jgi:site-specific DNA-adenine methylase
LNWYGVKDESKFGRLSHKRLADLLKNTKSRWALSYYYYDDLEVWFPKDQFTWITKDFFRSSASFSENKELKGTELLILNYDPNLVVNNTTFSEKLINEIEEENNGAFINSNIMTEEEKTILNDFTSKFIASQKDIDPEIAKVVNSPGVFNELLEKEKEIDKKEDDIDDFWK